MNRAKDHDDRLTVVERGQDTHDKGISLLEVLVAVILLGIGGTAILTAFTDTIRGTDRHRGMVTAEAWIQSAGDHLTSHIDWLDPCSAANNPATVRAAYESELRLGTSNSDGWPAANLVLSSALLFWNGSAFTPTPVCHLTEQLDASGNPVLVGGNPVMINATPQGLRAQLVELRVASPDGKVARLLTVVKA